MAAKRINNIEELSKEEIIKLSKEEIIEYYEKHIEKYKRQIIPRQLSIFESTEYVRSKKYRDKTNLKFGKISLDLSNFNELKFPNFDSHVREVCSCNCYQLTDVSNLKLLDKLCLSQGNKILNMHFLSSIHSLIIIKFKKIKNVSDLTGVKELHLVHVGKIDDIGNLRQLEILKITHYVNGIHLLINLKKLEIVGDELKTNKKMITSIKKLRQFNKIVEIGEL